MMNELGMCSHGHVEQLFPHSGAGTDDSKAQALDDLDGRVGGTHDS